MKARTLVILASAMLAGSLLATDAQARGGGGGGHGGGGGGGHGGGFGGGHMGGFGGHMAGIGRGHFGGERRFGGIRRGGYYGYGLGCPYYGTYSWPYACNYSYW